MISQEQKRSWGDGKAFSPQGIMHFLDRRRSWVKKFFEVAESNGCPRRERHIRGMMRLHHTRSREAAARFALIEDLRINHLYQEMVRMAESKRNKKLFRDITQTVHRSVVFKDHESHAPEIYRRGRATGLANDAAWDIIKTIADIWQLGLEPDDVSTRVCRAMDQLQRQIVQSSTLKELRRNFLGVYKRSLKRAPVPV